MGAAAALPLLGASRLALAQNAPLRIGVIPSVANEATEIAIDQARAQGVQAKLVELADWVMPNVGVAEGSLDVNYFQHAPFLDLFNKSRGQNLVPIAYGYSTTIGLFSKKLKRGDAMPHGASIGIPADPVNTGRALLLLQAMGLIRLKEGVAEKATLLDVTDNPHKLKFVSIEGSQASRTFDDVTASVTYTTFAKHGGLDEKDGLAFDNNDPANVRRYAIRWVTLPNRAEDARLLKFIGIYQQSPEVKATLRRLYGDLIDFPWQA
ncbi:MULTISPECIES: MetQ/NlpA family ABC transporter substrate-binding protein [unclassified Achromobacter]|uniref:MetQ/NlpA family ABC transporter substrate-binding protein n=1 Tax=unclassified Achromobacter TaxID=2626865 RepID=UPI000B514BE5|nr:MULTISPECIES: MetQ/NlpA family ABC transporter substrate-binding protein [unclassified Achromobacter]OWT81110.1 iron ABC transporter substrate-binding protein [Achromobacter sp. HZ34]OWT82611.1 iron ABC transporter substrate-binding protein [Achromobacter sp. HZ28]